MIVLDEKWERPTLTAHTYAGETGCADQPYVCLIATQQQTVHFTIQL